VQSKPSFPVPLWSQVDLAFALSQSSPACRSFRRDWSLPAEKRTKRGFPATMPNNARTFVSKSVMAAGVNRKPLT
jgi:hypothetical protein